MAKPIQYYSKKIITVIKHFQEINTGSLMVMMKSRTLQKKTDFNIETIRAKLHMNTQSVPRL